MEKLNNLKIEYNCVYDFISSLAVMARYKELEELNEEYGLSKDKNIENWLNETRASFDKQQQQQLNRYFEGEISHGLGLITYGLKTEKNKGKIDIEQFMVHLEGIEPSLLISYLLNECYQGENRLKEDLVKKWLSKKDLFEIINENFDLSEARKWQVYRMLNKPLEIKNELIKFLETYYNNYYINEEKRVASILDDHIKENEEDIKKVVCDFLENIFTPGDETIDFKKDVRVILVYFGEYLSSIYLDYNTCLFGFKFDEFVKKVYANKDDIEEQAHVFKALGDKTRLKMLQELLTGPKYMTELGEKLDVSTPTINYHMKKFINAGLVQIDKAGNRIYYKIRKKKLESIIKLLESNYHL